MDILKHRYSNMMLHMFLWSLVLCFPFLASDANNQYRIGPLPGFYFVLSGIIHMVIFYGNTFFLYPKLANRAYWWLYVISVITLIALSVRAKFYILEAWFPDSEEAKAHVLFPSLVVFTVSVFYSIVMERMRTEQRQKESDVLLLEMELKFLRSQISPHFLFNLITNLVSLARKKSDNLESSLLKLSGLMRYMLYDADKKISLQQEVEYLESFISLQRLRFERDVEIVFSVDLSPEQRNYCIEPMLLISF